MGQKLFSMLQTETKRLLWLIGMTFSVILVFQYFELPYSNVFSSLFTANKIPSEGNSSFQIRDPPSKSGIIGNMTLLNGSISSGGYDIHEIVNEDTRTSKGKNTKPKHDLVSEIGRDSHKPLEIDDRDTDSTVDSIDNTDHGSAPEPAGELEWSSYRINDTTDRSHLSFKGKITPRSEHKNGSFSANFTSPSPAKPPLFPSSPLTSPTKVDPNITIPVLSSDSNIAASEKDLKSSPNKNKTSRPLQSVDPMSKNSSTRSPPKENKEINEPNEAVTSISEMNKLLIQSRGSSLSMIPQWPSEVDQELVDARSQIENAPNMKNDPSLYAPLYRNVSTFKRSYELMEDTLQVYIYREGKKPILHQPILKGIYASEGWFMRLLEANKKFVTKDPKKAHLFYLPFSSRMLEETLYNSYLHSHMNLIEYLKNYLDLIARKYPFWNRAGGADHFLVACHDWAPAETREHMAQCIRALCNSDVKEGFVFGKDVSLPETNIRSVQNPAKDLGGKPPSQRSTLAFFAGGMHGYLRPILLQHWKDKDPDIKVFGKMPKSKGNRNYIQYMKSSKYCICAKGHEVNSPRVVEAIFYECVPVIISDNFVPPFFEILNWESFAVFVLEKDIPNLKTILHSIPQKRYLQMQMRVKKVQQHFIWHAKPVKYDIFHMILHSVWYNRVFNARVA
ncbi:Exostosin family protein [Quillaja saponaria]|uniref:Exostosin family protein n=1 Tax=Quillaja saponaria TaxID=32244 RepID=A0AAD7LX56_QUISA|nr:Exostosin family protein [Quillaja saponaria]KAJ7965949.1 Exostosin family protein [Quillaja saponaria]